VDSPEELRIREIEGTSMTVLEIKVSKQDVAYLLGDKGKNMDALRTLVVAAGKVKQFLVNVTE
jgi:predicted RNA-binding protein YlqC (UPF0109 family)